MLGTKINLNDSAIFRLTERGRTIWRRHCLDIAQVQRSMNPNWKPSQSGDESAVKLQLWQFIQIFGGSQHWQMGGPYVLDDMNIEIVP